MANTHRIQPAATAAAGCSQNDGGVLSIREGAGGQEVAHLVEWPLSIQVAYGGRVIAGLDTTEGGPEQQTGKPCNNWQK
ncbi:MAG UNVERIFIED_CONTAM: hypothetical protein LVR18_00055 [Planctomycetaceae bacterium]